jgi:hypothetical protein
MWMHTFSFVLMSVLFYFVIRIIQNSNLFRIQIDLQMAKMFEN